MCIVATEEHLMERVSGVLIVTMLEMFYNSSSSHADDIKNNFLILDERDTFGINGSFGAPEKTDYKNVNFPTQFFLGSISNRFSFIESREVSLNENVHDFPIDCNFID